MCHATPDSSCFLPNSLQAPALARDFVKTVVCTEHAQAAEAALALLTDELVTQAIMYGAPPVSLTLRCTTTEVTVEVADASPVVGSPQPSDDSVSMLLVDKISRSWGTNRTETGRAVWCKVPSGALPKPPHDLRWSTSNEPAAHT
jgi:hypothetical protein